MSARIAPAAGAVFLASALVLGLQIAFIRVLSLDTYHHFTYLVISTALLGFGASGTMLSIARGWISRRFTGVSAAVLVLLVVSAAYAYRVAVVLRPDMQYVLYSFAEVLKLWAHTLVLFLPFFFGGAFIGLALATFHRQVGGIYAANMIGSGVGGVGGVLLAFLVVPYRMPAVIAVLGVAALLLWILAWPAYRSGRGRIGAAAALGATVVALAVAVLLPVEPSVDEYKPMAHAQRLARQGDARAVAGAIGPRAQIDVFDVPSMHHALFAAPTAPAPPPQLSVFLDGAHAGGVFVSDTADEAEVVRHTAQALAYRLVDSPRVLLLGEQTGVNVWLALAHGAREVVVVQPNPQIRRTLEDTEAGAVFRHPSVEVVHTEPRHYLARAGDAFDIIHLAEAEGMPAGSGGLASMREDYLLTVEAVRTALHRLSGDGLLTVTRGMQSPPRDNLRLFALFAEALREREPGRRSGTGGAEAGAAAADQRLLQARNYLAVTTIAAARPLDTDRIGAFREAAAELSMDADYHPGISPGDLTDRNRVPGPEEEAGSYYYHAATRMLGDEAARESFYDGWIYNIRPPTDDNPYFHSFFRWDALDTYIRSYGHSWFQRLELGYAVVFVTFLQVLLAALVLVLAPVLLVRRRGGAVGGVGWTVLHFTAIGLGFLLVEMLHIQRFTRFLGDPIYATAAVLTAILVFSGTGSYLQGRLAVSAGRRIRIGGPAVAALALTYYVVLDPVLGLAVDASEPLRFIVSLLLLFPISFVLGWLMPAGLEIAGNRSGDLIPLAWAVNGVASVAATPLSVMIATGAGFLAVSVLAAACYLLVAAAAPRG
ncbi:MAG: hypothetical protein ACLFPO_03090 [Spirochaetaceae bacterium]